MNSIKPFGLWKSLLLFGSAEILFAAITHLITPWLVSVTYINPFIISQLANTILLFAPLFFLTLWFVNSEGYELKWENIRNRLYFRKITLSDLKWMFSGLIVALLITILIIQLLKLSPYNFNLKKMENFLPITLRPLVGLEMLFLVFFPVSFFFNYVGEEILWRGYLFSRQELVFGRWTWVISGVLHTIFHLHLGPIIIPFFPFLFAIPFVYAKTKNVYIVILMHSLLGAPSDLLLALGV